MKESGGQLGGVCPQEKQDPPGPSTTFLPGWLLLVHRERGGPECPNYNSKNGLPAGTSCTVTLRCVLSNQYFMAPGLFCFLCLEAVLQSQRTVLRPVLQELRPATPTSHYLALDFPHLG